MSEASEIRDEKNAEAQRHRNLGNERDPRYPLESREQARLRGDPVATGFSVSLSGTKEGSKQQIDEQVKDSAIASALKAIVDAAPGNGISLSGTMEVAEGGGKGKLTITGIFKTTVEEPQTEAERQRGAAQKRDAGKGLPIGDYAAREAHYPLSQPTPTPSHNTVRGAEIGTQSQSQRDQEQRAQDQSDTESSDKPPRRR